MITLYSIALMLSMQTGDRYTEPQSESLLLSVNLNHLPDCDTTPNNESIAYEVRLRLSNSLSGDPWHVRRLDKSEYQKYPIKWDRENAERIIAPNGRHPIDMNLSDNEKFKYVMVRVILSSDSNFRLADSNKNSETDAIFGHTNGIAIQENPGKETPICGTEMVKYLPDIQYTTFYVDLTKMGAGSSILYNIVLLAKTSPDTPIIIDPKIHDTGVPLRGE